jgi:hypothetical protein
LQHQRLQRAVWLAAGLELLVVLDLRGLAAGGRSAQGAEASSSRARATPAVSRIWGIFSSMAWRGSFSGQNL